MTLLTRPEVEALCTKAARGAGMAWGLAEEAGFAAGWLQAHGIDGAGALAAYLDGGLGVAPVASPGHWTGAGPLCPIATGAALSDFRDLPAGALPLRLDPVAHPVLLRPFLGAGRVLEQAGGGALILRAGGPAAMPAQLCPADPAAVARLESLAFETYVPPSAQSRADAGAAGSDND